VPVDLSTTNTFLGVIAAVSVLEALAVALLVLGDVLAYRRVAATLARIEARHVAPSASRINAVLDDVKAVSGIIRNAAEDLDAGARSGWGRLLDWILTRNRAA